MKQKVIDKNTVLLLIFENLLKWVYFIIFNTVIESLKFTVFYYFFHGYPSLSYTFTWQILYFT